MIPRDSYEFIRDSLGVPKDTLRCLKDSDGFMQDS